MRAPGDRRLRTLSGLALAVAVASGGCGLGQASDSDGSFSPSGQLTMVSAFGAGGGTDKVARAMLSGIEDCDSSIQGNVEYREGGSGVVGYSYFQSQEGNDDMVMASTTELTTLPLFVDTPFTWESFTPIAQVADDQVSLALPADSPYQNLDDLVEAAKTQKMTVAVVGLSGPDNIVRELLQRQTGATFEPVIFEGGGDTTAALLGGDVDAALGGAGDIAGQVESGDVRALAVFGKERYQDGALASTPTAEEQGYDITFTQWRGLLGPPGMSDAAEQFYADCLEDWTHTDSYQEYLDTALAFPAFRRGEEFKNYLADQETLIRETLNK
jgi:putative tricarboxylic transport membrane protein